MTNALHHHYQESVKSANPRRRRAGAPRVSKRMANQEFELGLVNASDGIGRELKLVCNQQYKCLIARKGLDNLGSIFGVGCMPKYIRRAHLAEEQQSPSA